VWKIQSRYPSSFKIRDQRRVITIGGVVSTGTSAERASRARRFTGRKRAKGARSPAVFPTFLQRGVPAALAEREETPRSEKWVGKKTLQTIRPHQSRNQLPCELIYA